MNVALPDCVGSLTEVAATVTVKVSGMVAGGLYVAPVEVILVSVPHADIEHDGVPQLTPDESFPGAFVTVAVNDSC